MNNNGKREVRLFPDWGHPWPLWEAEAGPDMNPDDYHLSPGLTKRLRRWYDTWHRETTPGEPWHDPNEYRRWQEEGGRLKEDLEVELGDDFAVTYTDYPTSPPNH